MKLRALVVSYDSGFRDQRMGAGPEHLVSSGLFDELAPTVEVTVERFIAADDRQRAEVESAVEIAQWLARRVAAARREGAFPLVLAGNCSSALGVVAGLQSRSRRVPGVCWFDAHADFNTPETSESGFFDGMALATLTGRCWKRLAQQVPDSRPIPDTQVLLFGARDVDAAERKALDASDVVRIPVDSEPAAATQTLGKLRDRFGEVYLHIDLDVLDPSEARVNPFATPGGYSRTTLIQLIEEIGSTFHVGAAALTAYDPSCDQVDRVPAIARQIVASISHGMR